MRNELPCFCFSLLPSDGSLIILKRGETGYHPSDLESGSKLENKIIADSENYRRGISPAQVMAMQIGSLYGFDVPGAEPQCYFDQARLLSTVSPGWNTTLAFPNHSFCEYVKGSIYQYQVAGEVSSYISPLSMPECMMGSRSNATLFFDLVHGKPLVPVAVKWTESGTCEMLLEHGSFVTGMEMNAGYQIIAKVQVGPVEYALGEHGGRFPSFVTWERTPANDGDGPPNYYWGHYMDTREAAIQDFCGRAEEKFEMLKEYRKPSIKKQLTERPCSAKLPAKPKDREVR